MSQEPKPIVALLLSGGLDSSILLGHLLAAGRSVQPIYIRTGVAWQEAELQAIRCFLLTVQAAGLRNLVQLELPLGDLYHDHWSMNGRQVPAEGTPDEAVYLPGRNPLLLVKAAVWCQLNGLDEIALASLGTNPFADATREFFAAFERALSLAGPAPLRIVRPFASLSKREVMQLGGRFPLEDTFSCIAPVHGLHCGVCNKCGERKAAFDLATMPDPTVYASRNGQVLEKVASSVG
jgi:7-cyano-7-deazaguanine synthase